MRMERPGWIWFALPAVAMSLGWGLRGFIGGGPLGAMIPGAMSGLSMAVLLGLERQAAWLAACGAIGVGLGGQMTYGQTVGLSLRPETFWWAMIGFTVKGAAWGLAGGAVLGAGMLRGRDAWSARRFLWGLIAMVAATWAGWRLVNAPKLVYFSDPLNKPREEVWAGLLAGALAFLLVAGHGPRQRLAWRFAGWAMLGGAAGFPLGAALQALGRSLESLGWLDWWKGMEFTFGALLGLGFAMAAWRSRADLSGVENTAPAEGRAWLPVSLLLAAAAAVVCIGIEYRVPLRFNYSLGGALVLAAALRSDLAARHAAITVTVAAFVLDLVENTPALAGGVGWAVTVLGAASAGVWATPGRSARSAVQMLTWAAVAASLLKTFLPPLLVSPGHLLVEAAFVAMAALCSLWMRPTAAPSSAAAVAS